MVDPPSAEIDDAGQPAPFQISELFEQTDAGGVAGQKNGDKHLYAAGGGFLFGLFQHIAADTTPVGAEAEIIADLGHMADGKPARAVWGDIGVSDGAAVILR